MLVIFDCDGVLIDSEIIASEVTAEFFTAEGFAITGLEMAARFAGMPGADIVAVVEDEMGHRLPEDFFARSEAEIDRRLAHVRIMPGAMDLLDALEGPRCVCSNSHAERLKTNLTTVGLFNRFKPYIFSAPEIGRSKPAPDVFLHAARQLDADPAQTIVVEDSVTGVTGAIAAGMRVIGFTGGSHSWPGHGDLLMEAGAETVVRRLKDVAPVVTALQAWGGLSAL